MGSSESEAVAPLASKTATLNHISLADPDIEKSVSLLKQACLDSGFFYVIDHGISLEFMDEVFAQSKKFFDLPIDEKMKLLRNEKHRGYTPILDETLDPDNQVKGDHKEGYYIGVEVPEDDPQAEKPFYGPNLWPSADLLPGWRETMEQYQREALRVTKAVAKIIALALDLDADFFDKREMLGEPIAVLRLIYYEGNISNPAKGIYGAGAHSDYGLLTLLATDDVVGLQVCKDKDAQPQIWEFVAPLRGALIVNLGDMLERWSNCIFRRVQSCRIMHHFKGLSFFCLDRCELNTYLHWFHRGVKANVFLLNFLNPEKVAYFVEPSHECLVECLPSCHSEANPPKFPPVTCGSYLLKRYNNTHANLSTYKKHET